MGNAVAGSFRGFIPKDGLDCQTYPEACAEVGATSRMTDAERAEDRRRITPRLGPCLSCDSYLHG